MKNIKVLLILTTVLLVATGCQSIKSGIKSGFNSVTNYLTTAQMPLEEIKPARIVKMNDAKKIAVLNISGKNNTIENRVESLLSNIDLNDRQFFTLIDRNQIDQIIQEQKFSSNDLFDENKTAKLGKLLGADTIITGSYVESRVETSSYQESRSKCSDKKCKKSYEYNVSCSKKKLTVDFTPKAVLVENGKILFTKTYSGVGTSKHCSDSSSPHSTSSELKAAAIDSIFSSLRLDVAPFSTTIKVDLIESDDSDLPDGAESLLDKGIKLAEHERYQRACDTFAKAQSQFTASLAINYNNGLCHEINGDLDTAIAFYESAESTTDDIEDLELVLNAFKRIKKRKNELKILDKMKSKGRI